MLKKIAGFLQFCKDVWAWFRPEPKPPAPTYNIQITHNGDVNQTIVLPDNRRLSDGSD